jgi:hypothetical protein
MSNTLADLTVAQLQKAISIREQIDALTAQLNELMGGEMPVPFFKAPKKGRRKMSAAARAKISAAAKARWAKAKANGKNEL